MSWRIPWVPESERNPYTIWYKYAKQNCVYFNKISQHYSMLKLQCNFNSCCLPQKSRPSS